MKAIILSLLLATALVMESQANYYGKRDKIDGFRAFLQKRMAEDMSGADTDAKEVLKAVAGLVQAWQTRQSQREALQKTV